MRSRDSLPQIDPVLAFWKLHLHPTTSVSFVIFTPPDKNLEPNATASMGGGGKVPYPKHVWSPSGGWYAQPHNWKANTAVVALAIFGITAAAWKLSAEREVRYKMPEKDMFFPSRK